MSFIRRLRSLYRGGDERTRRFHFALAAFDLATIAFLIASSFFPDSATVEAIDIAIGVAILVELLMRVAASRSPPKEILNPYSLADIAVIVSLLAPIIGEGFAFLRALRILRLVRSYRALKELRPDYRIFRQHDETIIAATNLSIFLFLMSALVYETQKRSNDMINNYLDAFYFTVTTLTTTGFGDITLQGSSGRLIAILIMIVGVSLFLRLVQVMIRPQKTEFKCPDCGLKRHDHDAVHCKACGRVLNIEDEGAV